MAGEGGIKMFSTWAAFLLLGEQGRLYDLPADWGELLRILLLGARDPEVGRRLTGFTQPEAGAAQVRRQRNRPSCNRAVLGPRSYPRHAGIGASDRRL